MINPELNLEPIQEASVENHEKLLSNRVLSIQLNYAERVGNGDIPFIDGEFKKMDFAQAAAEYTWIPRMIRHEYAKRTGIKLSGRDLESDLEGNEEFANILHEIMENISREHESTPNVNELAVRSEEVIKNIIERLPEAEEKGGVTDEQLKQEEAGSITYKVAKNMRGLEKYGISPDDLCVDVHFEGYRQKLNQENKELKWSDIKNSFRQLAQNIKERHQDVKAIVGSSWLLDSQIASKIGFVGLELYNGDGFSQGNAFWGQFIDSEGQIKQKEVDKFLETGKPKHRLMVGHILIDKFLEKYGE